MLDSAGVDHRAVKPAVDEDSIKALLSDAAEIASELAAAKALSIGGADWVIGSDSVVSVGDRLFDKPCSRDEAADHLRFFSGKVMHLTSAVALAKERSNGSTQVGRYCRFASCQIVSSRIISMLNGPRSATLLASSG